MSGARLCMRTALVAALGLTCAVGTGCRGKGGGKDSASRDNGSKEGAQAQADETRAATADQAAADVTIGDPPLPGITEVDESLTRALSETLAAKGADYEPRTEHTGDEGPRFTNRLIRESSPYLLQHAHNPVNWFAWGDEAFARAKAQDRPVLLSIGYSTCHWCHVMERESFEDLEVAKYINEHFIPIKVDREERPDLDGVYMSAVQMLTGRGGWPMTVVLTPDKKPFFGGTYFPARDGDRGARKGFLTILEELSESYATDREGTVEKAKSISERMAKAATPPPGRGQPTGRELVAAKDEILERFDGRRGGFGNAPKFPRPVNLEFLLRAGRRTADPRAVEAVAFTMDAMLEGGIYDQVGGGFHRYSVDADWLVPHFEKMLYDNGQLLEVLADLYVLVEDPKRKANYAAAMRATADYLARDMRSPEGAYYAATDADSPDPDSGESEEGLYFTWTPAQLEEVLGADSPELRYATARWGVTEAGNFEGRTILSRVKTPEEALEMAGIAKGESDPEGMERAVIGRVLLGRDRMPSPARDEKILAGWNALAISGLARAASVLDDPKILNQARAAAAVVVGRMWTGSGAEARLARTYTPGKPGADGFLEDYALTVQALLDLYEADGDVQWLETAQAIQAVQDDLFIDEAGAYAMTPSDGEALLVRETPFYDGAVPSGNSVSAMNLLRLAEYFDDEAYAARARVVLEAGSTMITHAAGSVPNLLSAADFLLDQPRQIFIVAPSDVEQADALVSVVRASYVPNRILAITTADAVSSRAQLIPAIEGKLALKGKPTAFVCEAKTCKKPTSDPAELRQQLAEVTPLP